MRTIRTKQRVESVSVSSKIVFFCDGNEGWWPCKNKRREKVLGYPQSQHESPALNCPLKRSAEFTPLPLHCEQRTAPAQLHSTIQIYPNPNRLHAFSTLYFQQPAYHFLHNQSKSCCWVLCFHYFFQPIGIKKTKVSASNISNIYQHK